MEDEISRSQAKQFLNSLPPLLHIGTYNNSFPSLPQDYQPNLPIRMPFKLSSGFPSRISLRTMF